MSELGTMRENEGWMDVGDQKKYLKGSRISNEVGVSQEKRISISYKTESQVRLTVIITLKLHVPSIHSMRPRGIT